MHTVKKWCVSIKWQIINCELSMLSNCVESNLFIHLRFKVTYTKSQKQWLGICDMCNTKSGKANKVNIWINSIFVEKIFYRRSLMTWNAYFCHFIIFVCMLFWLFIHTRNWPAPICSFWRLNLLNSPMQLFWQNGIALILRKLKMNALNIFSIRAIKICFVYARVQ